MKNVSLITLSFISLISFLDTTLNTAYTKEIKIKNSTEKKIKQFTFRNVPWESSIEKVLGNEKLTPKYKSKDKIVYEGTFLDLKADITYFFNNEKLEKTAYTITKNYPDKIEYIKDFIRIEKSLSNLYNDPIFHNAQEINFMSTDRYENYIDGILNGNQNLNVTWNYNKTKINLILKKELVFLVRFEINFEKDKLQN